MENNSIETISLIDWQPLVCFSVKFYPRFRSVYPMEYIAQLGLYKIAFLNQNFMFIDISLKFVPRVPIDDTSALVWVMVDRLQEIWRKKIFQIALNTCKLYLLIRTSALCLIVLWYITRHNFWFWHLSSITTFRLGATIQLLVLRFINSGPVMYICPLHEAGWIIVDWSLWDSYEHASESQYNF